MAEQEIGVVTHFFDKISVAIIQIMQGELAIGDTIHIKGHTSDVTTTIASMQVEHTKIENAKAGDAIGTKLPARARPQDRVYKVTP
jgi:translation elongation factor EF-1alpha